jgi:hypothetical protein
MQLTTEYRDKPVGVMTGDKSFFLVCTVTLTEEEKAIAQERGLYNYHIEVEQDVSLPRGFVASGCGAGLGLVVFLPVGAFVFLTQAFFQKFAPWQYSPSGQVFGLVMALIGGSLWGYDYISSTEYEKRKEDPYLRITLGQIIMQPTFVIGAVTNLQLREHEATVREQLKSLAELIRESAPIGESNTYEL